MCGVVVVLMRLSEMIVSVVMRVMVVMIVECGDEDGDDSKLDMW